ncbi:hypothetical protein QQS21_003947 [Conoideocrella luteorostrata]|uniref:Protein kinase domain-containing protein n=1 Tax=Conoideocrella luteorostrata TaxID=1105319 RepID=A0AAJ0G078_9HYPO|nr:hypothetical protein QQS21_003947 [Conoideocrella luteorostrata]
MERSELFPGDSHHVETEDGYATSVSISYQRQRDMPYPVDGIASFCLLAADSSLDIQFKPRTFERPWVLNAGKGYTAVVESHRYVPGRQFNNFNGRYAGDPKANTSLLQAHAFDPNRTGQYYAVKRLASSKKARGNSKDMALQFDQLATELRIMAFPALRRHPNILSLLGSGHFLGEPVLILEDANCGNLAQFLTSPLIWPNRLFEMKMNLCLDVARGLKALHDHGVIHGDIKLENVLVVCNDVSFYNANRTSTSETACRNFTAKLCDFGFSIIVSDADSAQRSLKGFSRYWAAPEAATDKPIHMEMLPRTDIYSAGLVFASIFLEGVYPLKAFAKSVLHSHDEDHLDSFIAEIFPMPETDVKDLAKYALFHQELTKNISENTAISFGKMYCRFELEMISAILDKTLAKEAVLRPLTGGALFRFIEGIWRNRYDSQWREHRKECPGALAMHELNGSKFKMEVFTENFTKTPYPSGECTQW